MGHEDLERLDDVHQSGLGHGFVGLGLLVGLVCLDVVNEDDVVLAGLLALVVDLGLLGGALHFDCCLYWC